MRKSVAVKSNKISTLNFYDYIILVFFNKTQSDYYTDKSNSLTELQSEATAFSRFRINGNISSVLVHYLFAKTQPDARTCCLCSEEWNEYFILYFG